MWGLSCLIWTLLNWFFPERIIWTHSEKFVSAIDQPHQGKSVHVNSHKVTTKDISSPQRISYPETEWLGFISIPRLALRRVHKSICAVYMELNATCSYAGNEACTLCADELACLNIFHNNNPPRWAMHWSKFCKWNRSTFSSVWGAKSFSRTPYFAVK